MNNCNKLLAKDNFYLKWIRENKKKINFPIDSFKFRPYNYEDKF